jgi:hypothetical protein
MSQTKKGEQTAVMLDLELFGEELQDFPDALESRERIHEPARDAFEAIDELLQRKKNQ